MSSRNNSPQYIDTRWLDAAAPAAAAAEPAKTDAAAGAAASDCSLDNFRDGLGAVIVDNDQWQRYLASDKRDFHDFVRAEKAVNDFVERGCYPPLCNTGGNSEQYIVDDIKSRHDVSPNAAFVDYLRFTFPVSSLARAGRHVDEYMMIAELFADLRALFNIRIGARRAYGRFFYERSYAIDGTKAGGVYIGGNRGTCCVDLPGSICARAKDWAVVAEWLKEIGATITRVDLARDCLEGEYTLDNARRWYEEGGFTINRRPSATFLDDMGSGKGSTFYVGSRDNGKMMRVYEKGKQQGDKNSPWVRFELELKNRDRDIPLDILANPGGYLAGAYPCLSWINKKQERVKTLSKALKISYEKLKKEAKKGYGRLINFMLDTGFTAAEIVEDLVNREGYPRRMDVPLFSMGYD